MSDVIEQGYPRAGGLRGEEMRTPDDVSAGGQSAVSPDTAETALPSTCAVKRARSKHAC
jgi:hypothetical protein